MTSHRHPTPQPDAPTNAEPAVSAATSPRDSETGAVGVGMPAVLHLNTFGREIEAAFGHVPYLVGSAARGKRWRDVDVRLILPDDEFDQLFPQHLGPGPCDGKWALLCAAISELGKLRTGLPIDFQIQRATDANRLYPGIRHALGIAVHPRGYDTAPPAEPTPPPAHDAHPYTVARFVDGMKALASAGTPSAAFAWPPAGSTATTREQPAAGDAVEAATRTQDGRWLTHGTRDLSIPDHHIHEESVSEGGRS